MKTAFLYSAKMVGFQEKTFPYSGVRFCVSSLEGEGV